MPVKLLMFPLLLISSSACAWCFEQAASRYGLDPLTLQAIAIQESRMNQNAINHNRSRTGKIISTDYGVMQVNSTNVSRLVRYGVISSYKDLLSDPCLNIQAGAWVLARHLTKCGQTWQCLGSYNAGFSPSLASTRQRYARQVHTIWLNLRRHQANS
ncbi:TPA: lytic transglycosylase domain-containing protein [Klebsiella quasipneumoniae subsp. similipneumoniae]